MHSSPVPEFRNQSLSRYHRTLCGIESPRSTTSPDGTLMMIPPLALVSRHLPASFVWPRAVTYFGFPSTSAMLLRWQRSSGANSVINGGFQRLRKLNSGVSDDNVL